MCCALPTRISQKNKDFEKREREGEEQTVHINQETTQTHMQRHSQ